jgi:prophage DNA circulation protein
MAAPQEVGLTAQEQYDVASWQVGDQPKLFFPVESITDNIGNRLIGHKRAYREGERFDDTGGEARSWQIEVCFNNTIVEPGLSQNGRDLFPDVLRLMQRTFSTHECGNLVVPGIGSVRARAQKMTSVERIDEVDTARATLVFVEDNEEALDRTLIRPPTARATTRRLAEQTVFSQQSSGGWDGDLNGLVEFAAEVEALLLAPGRATSAVETQVRRNRRALERITAAQQQLAEDVGLETNRPRGSSAERLALLLRDRQAQAAAERSQGAPRIRPFRIDVEETSIFEVASRFDQDAFELMELNDSRIADPFTLRRGEVVLVYQTRPRA